MILEKRPKKIESAEQTSLYRQTTAVSLVNTSFSIQIHKFSPKTTYSASEHLTPMMGLLRVKGLKICSLET
jgi:hypothetical protein